MHQNILIKVRADSLKEAREAVRSALDESCNGDYGWDYVDEIEHLTENWLKEKRYKSWKSLEEAFKKMTCVSLRQKSERIAEILTVPLAEKFMTQADALLNTNTSDSRLKNLIEDILKTGRDVSLPKPFNELFTSVTKVVIDTAKLTGMFGYYINCIKELDAVLKYPEEDLAITTIDSYYAELNLESGGKDANWKVYYFIGSRHH